jgi:thiol-disulfide isomerase/thioredoxin
MRGRVLKLLPILLAWATLAHAQEALEVLRQTAATYKSAKSWDQDGIDKLEEVRRGKQRTTTRAFHAWRQGASMRVDFADGGMRLTDGHSEWNSTAQSKPPTKKPVPWDSRGRHAFNEFYYNYEGIADFVKSADFVVPPGKDGFLIEVTYELPGRVAGEMTKNYWIDAQHHTVRRETSNPVAMLDPPTAGPVKLTRTITFEKVDLNAQMDPALFTVPADEPARSGPAPDFALTDLEGAPVSLKDLRGKAVLLYFWASWCATCRAEMPKLEQMGQAYRDRGLVLLGINDEDPEIASAYLKTNGHTIRSLVDRWKDVYKRYQIGAIPTMILIAKDGRIVSDYGYGEVPALEAALKKAGVD